MNFRRTFPRRWLLGSICALVFAGCADHDHQLVISVPEQRMVVLYQGFPLAVYPVSTSRFCLSSRPGSYGTPEGQLEIAEKIGDGLPAGAVLKSRQPTGEVLPVDAPGRDPVVTRILWLRGLEARNSSAYERDIYIHGTPEERRIGTPASFGCVRMRSRDIIALYDAVGKGARVFIEDRPLTDAARPVARTRGDRSATAHANNAGRVGRSNSRRTGVVKEVGTALRAVPNFVWQSSVREIRPPENPGTARRAVPTNRQNDQPAQTVCPAPPAAGTGASTQRPCSRMRSVKRATASVFRNVETHRLLAHVEIYLARRTADVAEIRVRHLAGAIDDAAHDRNFDAFQVPGRRADFCRRVLEVEQSVRPHEGTRHVIGFEHPRAGRLEDVVRQPQALAGCFLTLDEHGVADAVAQAARRCSPPPRAACAGNPFAGRLKDASEYP